MQRKTRRNQLISRSIIIFVTMFIIISLLVCCGNGQACTYRLYTVGQGDTLYGLHAQYGRALPYHTWAAKMYKLNDIEVGQGWLYEGQEILLLEAVKQ